MLGLTYKLIGRQNISFLRYRERPASWSPQQSS
jgi:hypothetical protein